MTCRHQSGPNDTYTSELGQIPNRLRWSKTYCNKCRQLTEAAVVDSKPPAQIDQPYLPDGSFDNSVSALHNDSAAPNLTGESNDTHPLTRLDPSGCAYLHSRRAGFLSLVPA